MTGLGRWFVLNVALGVFPLSIKILLRIASQASLDEVIINSSDVIVLGLTVSITTVADLLRVDGVYIIGKKNLYEWTTYSVGAMAVFSAVWYGIQEASILGQRYGVVFRENTWGAAIIFVLAVVGLCFVVEKTINQTGEGYG